jgi:hypothetical protein
MGIVGQMRHQIQKMRIEIRFASHSYREFSRIYALPDKSDSQNHQDHAADCSEHNLFLLFLWGDTLHPLSPSGGLCPHPMSHIQPFFKLALADIPAHGQMRIRVRFGVS